ncbi:MAG: hypothetical protein ACRECF_04415 [Methyloceanibacter sp.]
MKYRLRTSRVVDVLEFRPGPEARKHPAIDFRGAVDDGIDDFDRGVPPPVDRYWLKDGYTAGGMKEPDYGDVILTFDDGRFVVMRHALFSALFEPTSD